LVGRCSRAQRAPAASFPISYTARFWRRGSWSAWWQRIRAARPGQGRRALPYRCGSIRLTVGRGVGSCRASELALTGSDPGLGSVRAPPQRDWWTATALPTELLFETMLAFQA